MPAQQPVDGTGIIDGMARLSLVAQQIKASDPTLRAGRSGRRLLLGLALLLAFLSAGLWAGVRWWHESVNVVVPIAPMRAIHFNVWKPGPDYAPIDFNRGSLLMFKGPLTVATWYQDHGSTRITHLGTWGLPTWPLLVFACGLGIVVAWDVGAHRGVPRRKAKR